MNSAQPNSSVWGSSGGVNPLSNSNANTSSNNTKKSAQTDLQWGSGDNNTSNSQNANNKSHEKPSTSQNDQISGTAWNKSNKIAEWGQETTDPVAEWKSKNQE